MSASSNHRVATPAQHATLAKPVEPAAAVPARSVAIFIAHGMGQQVPFETLDAATRGLIAAAGDGAVSGKVAARTVRIGDKGLQRLELGMLDAKGRGMSVHVYEAYWAPLTEGRVTLRNVMRFLFRAGINGLRNARGHFRLWMFGEGVDFKRRSGTAWQLLLALLVVLSLVLMNALTGAVVAARVLQDGGEGAWPDDALLAAFNTITAAFVAVSALFGVGLGLALLWRRSVASPHAAAGWRAYNTLLQALFWVWVLATVLSGLLFAGAAVADQFGGRVLPESWLLEEKEWLWLWLALFGVSYYVRGLLVQYVGDVAVYVASHTLDEFHELRQQIKQEALDPARAIYAAADENGGPLYDAVAVVGHSLGSVIAYDTLNALLNEDELTDARGKLDVAQRTSVLLTFGSPLDKIAFVFARPGATDHQRALAASVQPLIQDYARFRTMRWINVYAPRDIISASLDFFDHPRKDGTVNKVEAVVDEDALMPLAAHVEYWRNRTVFERLYEAL